MQNNLGLSPGNFRAPPFLSVFLSFGLCSVDLGSTEPVYSNFQTVSLLEEGLTSCDNCQSVG